MRTPGPLFRTALATLGFVVIGSCTSSTEPAKVTTIDLSLATLNMDAFGASQQLSATVLDQRGAPMSGAAIRWSSGAAGVATVSNTGLVTAVGNGITTISGALGGVTATLPVTVLQTAAAPVIVAGDLQSGTVLSQLAVQLQVRIADRLGNAMVGSAVTFAVIAGGGSIGTPTMMSGLTGLASTTWTLGSSTAGAQQVSASVAGTLSTTLFSATPLAGPAVALGIAPGNIANGQLAPRGTAVGVKPAVEVTDVLGNGVAGATVTFSVLTGGGGITGAAAITNVNGIATVGSWTLGPALGANTLQASFGGLAPVVFTATGTEDPCTPAGATPIAVGQIQNGTITASDCLLAPTNESFDLYRLDLVAPTSLVLEMGGAFDTWLWVLDFNTQAVIIENDDIQSGVLTNSFIATTLPAGSYLLRARTFGPGQLGAYTLSVRTAALGIPASIVVNAGNGQVVAPGGVAPVAPSVVVRDEIGTPVAGVPVTFAVVPGVGSVTGASANTNASGIATVGSWTLGAGANVLSATVASGALAGGQVVFSATGKASAAGFDISLRFVTVPTSNQLQTFSAAAARWESIITGDLPGQPLNLAPGSCNSPGAIVETVDDVAIVVRLDSIDGPGQILGSAGPCFIRAGSSLPALGSMRFDTADLAGLEAGSNFGNVILHEMGHVLGIGTIWSNKGFLQLPSPSSGTGLDTHFNGPAAVAAFNTVGGATYTGGNKVPVENSQGGAGTRNSHWRESVLQNEVMTGFLNGGSNPLSVVTITSLQDIGYAVSTATADAFFVSLAFRAEGSGSDGGVEMKDDIRKGGIFYLDARGRAIGTGGAAGPVGAGATKRRKSLK